MVLIHVTRVQIPVAVPKENKTMFPYFYFPEIHLGFLTIHTWGLLVGLGFVIGGWYSLREARRKKINENEILNLLIIGFISSFVGARLFYVLQFGFDYFKSPFEVFKIWEGGLMFYGGLIGAVIISLVYIKFKKLDLPQTADLLTPGLIIGLIIGRIGCFLINDHIGLLTDISWAIEFPDGSLRHPVIFYLILSNIILLVIIFKIKDKLKQKGRLFTIFIIWYSVSRLFLDFFRAKDFGASDPRLLGLASSQLISILILLIVSCSLYFVPKITALNTKCKEQNIGI